MVFLYFPQKLWGQLTPQPTHRNATGRRFRQQRRRRYERSYPHSYLTCLAASNDSSREGEVLYERVRL